MESDGGTVLTSAQKDELMDQVKQQIAIANAQELLTVRYSLFYFRRLSVKAFVKQEKLNFSGK